MTDKWMDKQGLIDWLAENNGFPVLQKMPVDNPITLKILKLPEIVPKVSKPEENKGVWYTAFNDKGKKITLPPLTCSATAVERFNEKYKGIDIIDKYAIFKKASIDNGRTCHSISLIQKENYDPTGFKTALEELKEDESVKVGENSFLSTEPMTEEEIKYVSDYREATKDLVFPEGTLETHFVGSYMKGFYADKIKRITDLFKMGEDDEDE